MHARTGTKRDCIGRKKRAKERKGDQMERIKKTLRFSNMKVERKNYQEKKKKRKKPRGYPTGVLDGSGKLASYILLSGAQVNLKEEQAL